MADLERAKVLIELRRLGEAREQLAAVLAAEPDNAEAATYLAQAVYLEQRYREAAEQSAAALRIQPRNQFAMRIHALALLNTDDAGRWQAQQVARQVVALGPEFAENHRIMAIVLRECGHLSEALAAIDRAVELDPDEADIHVARGSILRRMGHCGNRFRPGPAAAAYHAALRLEPESAYAVHDLAIVDLNGRRLRNALRGVLKAAAMDPGLGDLVRTNAATVIRHAVRRMHWVLTAVAFVALVLGGLHEPAAVPRIPVASQENSASPTRPDSSAAADSSSASQDPARLSAVGQGFGEIGLGVIVLISLWWLTAIPRRRRRFVLRAAWSSPPTALRLVVFGAGLVVCVLGVATGLRVFLSVAEPTLLALGIILRRIA